MIKKYTALCLITSTALYANDAPKPRIREIIVIDEEGTGRVSSIIGAWNRLQEEIRQTTDATIEKHNQEHNAQQEKMKREHDENIKNHSRSFLVRLKENAALLDQQSAEAKEKSDQQVNIIQETLNSSTQYQLAELSLENTKSDLTLHEQRRERIELGRKVLYGATPALPIASIIAGYQNQSLTIGGCLTLFSGLLLGAGYHYIIDNSTLIEHEITKSQSSIKKLETILVKFKPAATEDLKEESEDLKDNV
jgi:hypothetical protein